MRRRSPGKEQYLRLLIKEAALNPEVKDISYAPGICDAGAGPSADMVYTGPMSVDTVDVGPKYPE